jgi:hypothetical protein
MGADYKQGSQKLVWSHTIKKLNNLKGFNGCRRNYGLFFDIFEALINFLPVDYIPECIYELTSFIFVVNIVGV